MYVHKIQHKFFLKIINYIIKICLFSSFLINFFTLDSYIIYKKKGPTLS